jgi:hypothetical protein
VTLPLAESRGTVVTCGIDSLLVGGPRAVGGSGCRAALGDQAAAGAAAACLLLVAGAWAVTVSRRPEAAT